MRRSTQGFAVDEERGPVGLSSMVSSSARTARKSAAEAFLRRLEAGQLLRAEGT